MIPDDNYRLAVLLERFIAGQMPMLKQLKKTPVALPVAKEFQRRVDAATFLLKYLRGFERMDIGSGKERNRDEEGP